MKTLKIENLEVDPNAIVNLNEPPPGLYKRGVQARVTFVMTFPNGPDTGTDCAKVTDVATLMLEAGMRAP